MSTLRIKIKMDNAAFSEESGTEVSRILKEYAGTIEGRDFIPSEHESLLDYNGNIVGEAKVTR